MAQFGDFIARLFGGGTRGLSGDDGRVLLDDPELEYFNARLRKHRASEDLVEAPEQLWDGGTGRAGLLAHLGQSEYADNLGFTDVLVVLSSDDWHRTLEQLREPWPQRTAQLLAERLWAHCEMQDLHQVFPQRPFGFRFIEDGGHEMRGASLGLEPGEFVTGLLPNLYTGAVASSRPVISVLLHVPGAWEGYQEVGRLFSDQVQFTLGNHWLDNFGHPGLRVPALYRLQQYADGSFVHIVNPDGKQRYHITSQESHEGPAVLTLATDQGEPIAYMVLAIVEDGGAATTYREPAAEAPAAGAQAAGAPAAGAQAAGAQAAGAQAAGAQAAHAAAGQAAPPAAGTGGADLFSTITRTFSHGGNRTVIPADLDERMLSLRERGALFQRVHFARFMQGYDVYLGRSGEVGTTIQDRAATFEIRGRNVALVPHVDGIAVDGRPLRRGERHALEGNHAVEVSGQRLEFRDLREIEAEGWPYLGEIRRNGGTSHMVFGGRYKIGRDRRCKVRLPDEPSNDNIVWNAELAEGGTIRSRNGEIPKSRFYTDSIMVASEHAELGLDSEPVLYGTARHCYTYVRRGGRVHALRPAQERSQPQELALQPGDEILIGNCVFAVDYPPADGPRHAPASPEQQAPRISPDELARAAVSLDERPAPASGPVSLTDIPAAAGLGEAGGAPMRLRLPDAGPDSFMGIDPAEATQIEGRRKARRKPTPTHPPAEPTLPVDSASPLDVPDPTVKPPPINVRTYDGDSILGALPPPDAPRGALPAAPPAAGPKPAPSPATGAPAPGAHLGAPAAAEVAAVDEDKWQLELARPCALVVKGWMVTGEVVIGNHAGCAVVIPENRSEPDQQFASTSYVRLFVRGRRGKAELLAPFEATLTVDGQPEAFIEALDGVEVEIIRRAPDGEEDFRVHLALRQEPGLPDPRARLLALDGRDAMVRALFTQGLPLRQDRTVHLGPIRATAHFDGEAVSLRAYIDSYRTPRGDFRAFFVDQGQGWTTAPEDGSPLTLHKGTRLLVDGVLYGLH